MITFAALSLCALAHAVMASPSEVALSSDDLDLASAEPGLLTVFTDPDGTGTALDLLQHPERFHKSSDGGTPSFGETTAVIWARLVLRNDEKTPIERRLQIAWPHLDRIDLWVFDEKGSLVHHDFAGVELGFRARPVPNRFFVFPLPMKARSIHTVLLSARASGNLQLPITIATPEGLAEKDRRNQFLQGIYVGVIAVMLLYNLFLFLSARDRSYFHYVLYVLGFFLVQLGFTGLGFQYLWPTLPWLQLRYFPLFTGATMAASLTFTRTFLDTRRQVPRLDRILKIFAFIGPFVAFLGLVAPPYVANRICTILTPIAPISIIVTAVIVAHKGSRPARFFLLAFSMVASAILITLLRSLQIIPVSFLTENGMQLGAIADVVLLSFALGDRISHLRTENERAERASKAQRQKLLVIGRELDIARRIQSAVVQKQLPSIDGLRMACRFAPMSHVGGDFYDFHQTGPASACIVLADVSGHGVPAALIASMAQISFELQQAHGDRPRSVLEGMNALLLGRIGDYFLSAGCAHVDADRMLLRVASAGHPSLLLCHAGTERPQELRPPGRLIGPFHDLALEEVEVQLRPGDRVVMFSDAILEARNAEGTLFGMRRLKNFIRRNYELDESALANKLQALVLEWVGSNQLDDDFTLVVVDVRRVLPHPELDHGM